MSEAQPGSGRYGIILFDKPLTEPELAALRERWVQHYRGPAPYVIIATGIGEEADAIYKAVEHLYEEFYKPCNDYSDALQALMDAWNEMLG